MIKCCIFDLDGTVLDTINTITHYVNVTLEAHGIEKITVDECKYFAGNGARLLIERSLASKGITDEDTVVKLLDEYNAAYNAKTFYLTEPFHGINELLSSLKANGIKIAVVSNKPNPTVQPIIDYFFKDVFDVALGGLDGVPLKPDPAVPRLILEKLGISESETAWIGDTSVDVLTGKNLGVPLNIGVLWGFRKIDELLGAGADIVVERAEDILSAVLAVK